MKSKNIKICEKMMDSYLALDKNEVVPFKLSLHLLSCQKCRTEVHYLAKAEKIVSKQLKEQSTIPEVANPLSDILKDIKNPISMAKWIWGGIIMIIFLMIFGIACKNCAEELQVVFYIFFAMSICAYCAVFIASNLDYFIKKINMFDKQFLFKMRLN